MMERHEEGMIVERTRKDDTKIDSVSDTEHCREEWYEGHASSKGKQKCPKIVNMQPTKKNQKKDKRLPRIMAVSSRLYGKSKYMLQDDR